MDLTKMSRRRAKKVVRKALLEAEAFDSFRIMSCGSIEAFDGEWVIILWTSKNEEKLVNSLIGEIQEEN